jgi:hypothetical protein
MFEHLTLEKLQCDLSWDLMLKSGRFSDSALTILSMTGSQPIGLSIAYKQSVV